MSTNRFAQKYDFFQRNSDGFVYFLSLLWFSADHEHIDRRKC